MNGQFGGSGPHADDFTNDTVSDGHPPDLDLDDFAEDLSSPDDMLVETSGAIYDALTLISALEPVEELSEFEIHTFSYLSCLLYIYDGHPASSWGYSFSAIPPALPFSSTLSSALDDLSAPGLIDSHVPDEETANGDLAEGSEVHRITTTKYRLTARGKEEREFLSSLEVLGLRRPYLKAAASTSLVYSVPAVINSLIREPQLWQAVRTAEPRKLLVAISSRPLYDQFEALKDAIGRGEHHLSVPATVYVGYLEEQAQGGSNPSDQTE